MIKEPNKYVLEAVKLRDPMATPPIFDLFLNFGTLPL